MNLPSTTPIPPRFKLPARDWFLIGLALVVIGVFAVATPGSLLDKADKIGYAVCHQIDARSFFIGERPMPLCARCTGQYLGAMVGLLFFLAIRRTRVAMFPTTTVITALLVFIGVWALDGFNSYMTLFPGAPTLYEPRNLFRVSTGVLQGISVISLVWPVFNLSVWAEPDYRPSVRSLRELALLVVLGALIVLAVESNFEPLLLPLALLSTLGTLILLTLVMTVIILLVLKRNNRVTQRRELIVPLLGGLATSLIVIALIDSARASLTAALNLPF